MTISRLPWRVRASLLAAALILPIFATQSLSAQAAPTCQGRTATIVGTIHADRIIGTPGPDVIVGLGGADIIDGRAGNDLICSGWGDDVVNAGGGSDQVYGGYGADRINGGPSNDRLFGGKGKDRITGNGGDDYVNGGRGADSVMGGRGSDEVLGGLGPDRVVGGEGPDVIDGGAGRDVCAVNDPNTGCEAATLATRPAVGAEVEVDRVIHISIDGLRSDHVTPWLTPNLSGMMRDGVSTMNARTDADSTKTLPNHTSQFTGRPVNGARGHGVSINSDDGSTVHQRAGEYAASVFDVAHDNGLATAMFSGKGKFDVHERTWGGQFGRRDTTGADSGRNKIDTYKRNDPVRAVDDLFVALDRTSLGRTDAYIFFHIRLPDSAGHASGWGSQAYSAAVEEADQLVGEITRRINQNPDWANSTGYIVTSDHGGPLGARLHDAPNDADTYTIPFIVSAPGVSAGADLYTLNRSTRSNPARAKFGPGGLEPIRGHEAGNVALDLLGLPPIPGSVFNAAHDLRLN